jgi:dihydrofolate reductase
MRKLVYFVAVTADGYIAHLDGSHDGWVLEGDHAPDIGQRFPETIPTHWQQALGLPPQNKQFDTVLMGRKTYQIGLDEGITSPYGSLEQYVFSRSMTESPDPSVHLVNDDIGGCVRRLKEADGQDIWLCGGGEMAALLSADGLLDEVILKYHPVIFGSGIPLFGALARPVVLELKSTTVYASGVQLMHYAVKQQALSE